ncbi:MAG: hypothetical protein JNM20_14680 [Rhizobiales bacterium]|nr:hypothetical protein [Hyphomicrobiales bacterium]
MAETRAAKYSIICSDRPRNGKTLVARLIADYHLLCQHETEIFDLSSDPRGLTLYFPVRGRRTDLTKTADQMALLDRALTSPPHDCVVYVPPHLNGEFFNYLHQFDFSAAARAHHIEIIIYYVVDKASGSLSAAEAVRVGNPDNRFIIVWNEAFLPSVREGFATGLLNTLKKDGQLVLPKLPPNLLKPVEDPGFSFSNFVLSDEPRLPSAMADQLKEFLADIFRQLDAIEEAGEAAAD